MEAANNQGNAALPSSAPDSGDKDAAPLKLQLEVTLPRELGGELKAWRRAFERFADVMERWLESSLTHPNLPAPPPMPWMSAATHQPQQLAPQPPAPLAPTSEKPVPPETRPGETPVPPLLPPAPQATPTWTAVSRSDSKPAGDARVPAPASILPEEMPPLLVEDFRPLQAATPTQEAANGHAARPISESRPLPLETERTESADEEDSAVAEKADLQAQQGERYRMAGQRAKALACYQKALDLDSGCAQAYLGRASIYIEQSRLNEALLDCNSALRQQPERAVLYVLRGLVYVRLGNLKRALGEAEDAIRFDPRLPSAYMLRGNVRFKKGMTKEALFDVKQAIRLRPGDAKFHAELARLLAQTGEHEQAARIYAKALELAPNFHEARLQRCSALRQAGEVTEAEAELTEFLRRRPKTAAAHYQRGLCRLAQRNYAQAMTDFDKAIALNPGDQAAFQAKQQTLDQWEGTAKQGRPQSGSAATVALAATGTEATAMDAPASEPTRSSPVRPPYRPTPPKTSPAKPKPRRSQPREWSIEPERWVRTAKWVCTLLLAVLLGFGGFRLLANFINSPSYKPDDIPPTSAKLTADELVQRFTRNPASAKAELGEGYLEVHGVIQRHLDDKNPPLVVLAVTRSRTTVNCALKTNLSLHQQMLLSRIDGICQARIVGRCTGKQGNSVVLNECLLVQVIKGRGGFQRRKQ